MSPDLETASKSFKELSLHAQRRQVLKAIAATPLAAWLAACGSNEKTSDFAKIPSRNTILPETQYSEVDLLNLNPTELEAKDNPEFDIKYVDELLQSLKNPVAEDLEATLSSYWRNITFVRLGTRRGVALRVCESGYYLTCAHTFLEQTRADTEIVIPKGVADIYIPTQGVYSRIKSLIADPASDLAVFFAPSGKQRKRTPDIQLINSPLSSGQKLWLYGLLEKSQAPIRLKSAISHGVLDNQIYTQNIAGEKILEFVKGMTSWPGASGSPIMNEKGKLVAATIGSYRPDGQGKITHTIISPLGNLSMGLLNSKIYPIPGP